MIGSMKGVLPLYTEEVDWPQSLMSIFLVKLIEIYKLYLEVEVLGLDISKFDYQRG